VAFDLSTAKPETAGFNMASAVEETPEKPDSSRFQDFKRGLAESTLRTALGGYELFGGELSDNTKKAMEMMRRDVDASGGWGTAGNITGEIAQLALPAAGIAKGAKLLNRGAKSILAADIGLSATHGGLKLPEAGKTRFEGAVKEGAAALAGGVVGSTLRKAITGIDVTDAAKSLMDMGVYLTPDKASTSVLPRAMGYAMQITPFMAKGTREAGERSAESWNKVLLNRVAPLGEIAETGVKGVKALKNQFNDAYSAAWAKATKPSGEAMVDMVNEGVKAGNNLGGNSGAVLRSLLDDLGNLSRNYSSDGLKELDNAFRRRIEAAAIRGDDALTDTLNSMRGKLRASAGPDTLDALAAVDSKYGDFITIRNSASSLSAMKQGGIIDPATLMSGVKSAGGKTRAATGDAPLYDFASTSMQTLGRKEPNPIIDVLKGLAVNTPNILPLQSTGQAILGNTAPQKLMQKGFYLPMAEALRNYGVRGSIVGAANE